MSDWKHVQRDPSEALAKLHFFSVTKKHAAGEIEARLRRLVCQARGLDCPDDGLAFPPAGVHDLARVFRPVADGGRLARSGLVDIAASQEPGGREVLNNIRFGVFVTFKARDEYARSCFAQYGLRTDPSGS